MANNLDLELAREASCFCGATFRTDSREEIIEIIRMHEKLSHQKDLSYEDARRRVKDVIVKKK